MGPPPPPRGNMWLPPPHNGRPMPPPPEEQQKCSKHDGPCRPAHPKCQWCDKKCPPPHIKRECSSKKGNCQPKPPLCKWCGEECPPPHERPRKCSKHDGPCQPARPKCQWCGKECPPPPPLPGGHHKGFPPPPPPYGGHMGPPPPHHPPLERDMSTIVSQVNGKWGRTEYTWRNETKFKNSLPLLAEMMVKQRFGYENLLDYKWVVDQSLSEANKNFLVCLSAMRCLWFDFKKSIADAAEDGLKNTQELLGSENPVSEERGEDAIKYLNMCCAEIYCKH